MTDEMQEYTFCTATVVVMTGDGSRVGKRNNDGQHRTRKRQGLATILTLRQHPPDLKYLELDKHRPFRFCHRDF